MLREDRPVPTGVLAIALFVSLFALVSCSRSNVRTTSPDAAGSTGDMGEHPGSEGSSFGEAGTADEVDRVIRVALLDELRFDPASLEVHVGETIRFEVTNEGQSPHEFSLGDEAFQNEHETEMDQMGGSMTVHAPNVVSVDPGEVGSVIWTFTTTGDVLYGCHVEGHYAAGMVGTIAVV